MRSLQSESGMHAVAANLGAAVAYAMRSIGSIEKLRSGRERVVSALS